MNIEILQEYIVAFTNDVIDSGFKRDIDDYISSLPAIQNNIVALRDIAAKIFPVLDHVYTSDLPDGLRILFPKKEIKPFTAYNFNSSLKKLIDNTEIKINEFFVELTNFLNKLQSALIVNINELENIKQFINPYLSHEVKRITNSNLAIIAIVFNEINTITSLKKFTRILSAWNRSLPIYHQLLKSESPDDIQIVEVQNGSIEFVLNLDVDVALDLVELFKVGFKVFGAYLSYKKMIMPIIDTYYGNKLLVSNEAEREKLLLANIGEAINQHIQEQHKKAKKADKEVDGTAIPKKVEQITKLISSHIIKGNDLRLLALPNAAGNEENGDKLSKEQKELREQSISARKQLRDISEEDRHKLLEMYGKIEEETELKGQEGSAK